MASIKKLDVSHLIGQKVGTSTILNELARGGMAIVFVAFQQSLKRRIAVKILPKSLMTAAKAELFQQEAEAVAYLSHPNIIQIFDVGEVDEFIYFTMQLIDGQPMNHILKKAKKQVLPSKRFLPLKATLKLFLQILDALDYAHQQDIIHRDIKPENILIERHTQRPIITDFGVARVLNGRTEDSSIVRGSPLYMPPEQILGETTDARSDIYAAGTMLLAMLVTQLPLPKFKSHDALIKAKLLNKRGIFLERPSRINPQVNTIMDKIVQKATVYDPEKRFANCREFKNVLESYRQKYL